MEFQYKWEEKLWKREVKDYIKQWGDDIVWINQMIDRDFVEGHMKMKSAEEYKTNFKREYILQKPEIFNEYYKKNFARYEIKEDENYKTPLLKLIELDKDMSLSDKIFRTEHLIVEEPNTPKDYIEAFSYALENNLDKEKIDKLSDCFYFAQVRKARDLFRNEFIFKPEQIIAITDFDKEIEDKNLTNLLLKTNYYEIPSNRFNYEISFDDYKSYRRKINYDYTLFSERDIRNLTEIFKKDEELGLKLTQLKKVNYKEEFKADYFENKDFCIYKKKFSSEEIEKIKNKLVEKEQEKTIDIEKN